MPFVDPILINLSRLETGTLITPLGDWFKESGKFRNKTKLKDNLALNGNCISIEIVKE